MSAPPLPAPTFDIVAVHPEIGEAMHALGGRNWAAFRAVYDRVDHEGRALIMQAPEPSADLEAFLREVVRADPSDAVAAMMAGTVLVMIGWKIRTAKRAQYVSQDQFRQFHEYLEQAEQYLIDACALDPGQSAAWVERLASARGLELGPSEKWRRYQRLCAVDPHNFAGQLQMVQNLCPKWSGSWEKLHGFAQECARIAPEGAPNAATVADALYEHWVALEGDERMAYRRDPAVGAELLDAANRSIFSPQWRPGFGWTRAMNAFALAFCLTYQYAAAWRCFMAIGPYANKRVWSDFDDPPRRFVEWRERAFEHGATP